MLNSRVWVKGHQNNPCSCSLKSWGSKTYTYQKINTQHAVSGSEALSVPTQPSSWLSCARALWKGDSFSLDIWGSALFTDISVDIFREATWSIYGCKSKFLRPHRGLAWTCSPGLQVDCSRQRHEGWGTAGWGHTRITRARLKMPPLEKSSRQMTWWKEKGYFRKQSVSSLQITMKF